MNIIIDTHIFLWLANGDISKIKTNHLKYIKDTDNNIYLSSISIAEIVIKKSIGNLRFDGDVLGVLDDMDIKALDFDGMSAVYLETLPFYHRDPFDRMIISQSLAYNYKIITVDKKFKKYDCNIL